MVNVQTVQIHREQTQLKENQTNVDLRPRVVGICASKSNLAIIQRTQTKILRTILNSPWCITEHDYLKLYKNEDCSQNIKKTDFKTSKQIQYTRKPDYKVHPITPTKRKKIAF